MSKTVPTKVRYAGALYVLADVEVSYDALDKDMKFMVDLWLSKSSKVEGTPEYEEFKKQLIKRVLSLGEMTQTQMGQRMYAEKQPDLKDPDVAEAVKFVLGSAGITVEQICALGDNLRFLCEGEGPEEDAPEPDEPDAD